MISSISSTEYSRGVYSSQSLFSESESANQSTGSATNGTDTVSISEGGRQASLLSSIFSSSNGTVTLNSIQECLAFDTANVEDSLRVLYSKNGISKDTEMDISVGRNGKIIVKGDSEKAEVIEEAINNDPELSNTIRRMSANSSLLEAAKKHQEFAKAYEIDPDAAIKEFAYLFDDNREYHTSFTVSNGSISSEVKYV